MSRLYPSPSLGWLPAETFDGAVSMGGLARLRSRRKVCAAFRELLRSLRPGGRALVAHVEHPKLCKPGRGRGPALPGKEGLERCASCRWRVPVAPPFWAACTPIDMEVTVSTLEHTELPGTASRGAACSL